MFMTTPFNIYQYNSIYSGVKNNINTLERKKDYIIPLLSYILLSLLLFVLKFYNTLLSFSLKIMGFKFLMSLNI